MDSPQPLRVAAVQAAPALFDREGSLERVASWTARAARDGARLVLFPEAFIPAYPRGLGFGFVVGSRTEAGRRLWQRYNEQSVEVPGPTTERLGSIAREHGVYLSIGVTERDRVTRGTLYCTQLYFGPDGALLAKHRKLKPTGSERLIWGEGDGSTLSVVDTPHGRMGGLICWENYMPLARAAMYAKGVDFYLAPTADSRDAWQATMRHIACEGRCFVLGCNQFVTRDMYPEEVLREEPLPADAPHVMSRGGSVIVSPLGEVLAGPLWDEEGIVTADLDLGLLIRARLDFDPSGHYARPDVFHLEVDERERPAAAFLQQLGRSSGS
ncbi:carbon-nitrogen hydrolase family protein [Myxococcus sp. RHSTA-1-4]|uniref:carbon-nitrogen hydrolase family protein n=1 Tax=Myxococcus sp. RHSTA-1-4 TaxID=2874601 RepID=UPI001CC04F47|nr:carbon-nitrogen hydrolase family protein [Myxococcus sp. RHSTA-1-4]MBZ4417304.1 carbon-nitrogen hydrolase family protein [Myxococcus sp. RHSTA-1-4]